MSKLFGVDLSEFQTGVDYKKAVAEGGVQFAILRAGYGREYNQKDEAFDKHYKGFTSLGVPVGAYQYSYAETVEGAKREADVFLRWLDRRSLNLPAYLDMEERTVYNLGKTRCTEIADAWSEAIRKGGYRPGVYASSSWWNNVLNRSKLSVSVWVADWGHSQPKSCDIWQFGGSVNLIRPKTVAGISGTVDQNYLLDSSLIDGTETGQEKPKDDKPKEETNVATIKLPWAQLGSTGETVRTLQRLLISNGFSVGRAGADGIYGNDTFAAVTAWQKSQKGLSVDGIVGTASWNRILGVK